MLRRRAARGDASPDAIVRAIQWVFRLPAGSVKLLYPSGRKARRDSSIFNLRKAWKKK